VQIVNWVTFRGLPEHIEDHLLLISENAIQTEQMLQQERAADVLRKIWSSLQKEAITKLPSCFQCNEVSALVYLAVASSKLNGSLSLI